MKKVSQVAKVIGTLSALAAISCGRAPAEANETDMTYDEYQATRAEGDDQNLWAKVSVTFSPKESTSGGLQLSEDDSFEAKIVGCESGYGMTFSRNVPSVRVKSGDLGCESRIDSLLYGGETFTFDTQASWAAGAELFGQGNHGNYLKIQVISNIHSPVEGSQAVAFVFETVEAPKQKANTMVSALSPVQLELYGHSVRVDKHDGSGIFDLDFYCDDNFDEELCGDIAIKNLKIGLVRDTSNGSSLTLDECRSIANLDHTATLTVSPDASISFSGLKGPGQLYASENSELIFAVSSESSSCKFFRISVSL